MVNRLKNGVYRLLRWRRYLSAGSDGGGRRLRWRDGVKGLRRLGCAGEEERRSVDYLSPPLSADRFEFGHFGGKRPKCPHSYYYGPAALRGKRVFRQPI